ncbi:stage III sporulation protein AG [Salibacterium salarium]|uniref:stage III sporulation protein AG n=1 Tax=Salibacterium salarium TaxID=284579 RepID=UPI00278086A3|nr:stage III sporulation protein AG [Salibacterium salarium]MDQ0299583.1 stage III sporulation protein AG [Salibacterium salarium]
MAEEKDDSLKQWFKQWFNKGENKKPQKKKTLSLYLVVILVFGIVLMIVGTMGNDEEDSSEQDWLQDSSTEIETLQTGSDTESESTINQLEKAMQSRLKDMLDNISNVSDVTVMINLEGSEKKVYEKDKTLRQQTTTEEDQEGGTRELEDGSTEEQIVIVRQGEQEEPLLLHTKKPEAKGVLVVARGVEDIKVEEWVVEAVTRVLDIAPHKVSVLPRNQQEGE